MSGTCNCPYCKIDLEVYNNRWNGHCVCPSCNEKCKVVFDFYYGDDHVENDLVTLDKLEGFDKFMTIEKDLVNCEIIE